MPKPPIPPGMMLEKYRGLVPSWNGEEDEVYQAFLDEAKLESPEMQQALAASSDRRFCEYLRQLNLPKNRNKKSSTLAKVMDISMTEFTDFLRTAARARSLSIAAQRLPEITEHMADDALTQKEACGRCDGWGFVNVSTEEMPELKEGEPVPGAIRPMGQRWVRDCPQCSGTGKLKKPGDSHARDKILSMNGFDKKGSGVTVAINNYGGHGIESAGARLSSVCFDVSADAELGGDPGPDEQRGHAFEGDPVGE